MRKELKMSQENNKNAIERFFTQYWNTFKFLLSVFTIILIYIGVDDYINNKIDKKLHDEAYLKRVSKSLRPFLIFNQYGNFLYDHGASQYIDSLVVFPPILKLETNEVFVIGVFPKDYLAFQPLLENLSAIEMVIKPNQIENKSWAYKVQILSGLQPKPEVVLFRLEILR